MGNQVNVASPSPNRKGRGKFFPFLRAGVGRAERGHEIQVSGFPGVAGPLP